ncbi:MAG: hypothetical protein IPJ14_14865 [Kineosporiaceae bacterium]|nr:hypothetical protein [Kineosporiaceae bacterium]MBK7623899.1 hypothetical protein [Kineosporiaceae bacterium]
MPVPPPPDVALARPPDPHAIAVSPWPAAGTSPAIPADPSSIAGPSSAQAAWWTTVAGGALVLLSGFMPWSATSRSSLFDPVGVQTTKAGFAAGPTAWLGIILAATAAVIALAQVRPSVRLPRTVAHPATTAAHLAMAALACILIRTMSLTRAETNLFGMAFADPHLAGGGVLANLAAIVMVVAMVIATRRLSQSIKPDLGWSLATPRAEAADLDQLAPSDLRSDVRPGEVTASAALCFVVAGLNALFALSALVLGAGIGSISALNQFGSVVAAAGIIPAALCAWLIVIGLQLLGRRAWSRIACIITMGILGGVMLLVILSTSGDPTVALVLAVCCLAPGLLLCTRATRQASWR